MATHLLQFTLAVTEQYCLFNFDVLQELGSEVVFWSVAQVHVTHICQFHLAVIEQSWLFTLTFLRTWDQELFPGLLLLTFMAVHLFQSASQLLISIGTQAGCSL